MGARDCQREKRKGWRREVAGCHVGEFIVVVMHLLFLGWQRKFQYILRSDFNIIKVQLESVP
jgi:ABC-type glucose/galactose transport system permease subunit